MDKKIIWFDMDGTIANLYGVANWLNMLIAEDPTPYQAAEPMIDVKIFQKELNRVQQLGYKLGIISWLSKNSSESYDEAVTTAKLAWLKKNLGAVTWDTIKIVKYGLNKWELCREGILFDDEERNREQWGGESYEPSQIFNILKSF